MSRKGKSKRFVIDIGEAILFDDLQLLCVAVKEFNILEEADRYRDEEHGTPEGFIAYLEDNRQVVKTVEYKNIGLGFEKDVMPVILED